MPNELVELFKNDPMARREFLDIHNSLPLWVKILYKIRVFTGL